MKKFIRVGVDLAKNYFQIHALASEDGTPVTRKLTRVKMREFFSQIEPGLVGMEACAPRRVTEMAAAAEANRAAWNASRPSSRAAANAPLKQSPAPTVLTASTGKARTQPASPPAMAR